ncbi:MAG: hypothetical protein U0804_01525 [Gemmataceae bacterium]
MRVIQLLACVIAALPDGTERRPSRGLPPEALRRPEPPSLADVALQVCCPACARRAHRFIAWWAGARHVAVRGGTLLAGGGCDMCGTRIATGEAAVVLVVCPDTRTAARCLGLLLPGGRPSCCPLPSPGRGEG